MILIGIGANLPSAAGPPLATCRAALAALERRGIAIVAHSRWYRSAAHPPSAQPDFINGVAQLGIANSVAERAPAALLALLHEVEAEFGRRRGAPNAARSLDLDLLDHDGAVLAGDGGPTLPHPRMHERAFVLLPLADVAPDWRHPLLGASVAELIRGLPPSATATPIAGPDAVL